MRSKSSRFVVVVVFLATLAAAQNVTVPASLDGIEGGGGTNIPFGGNQACRYQVLYDAQELPWTGPRVVTGISLRADNSPAGGTMPAKGFFELSVLLSTSHRNSATASGAFEENYGEDATWVISFQRVQFPAQGVVASGPRPANVDLVFAAPWVYGLTPVRQGNPAPSSLLVEIWIHSQPSGSYRVDNLSSCIAPTATFGNQGPLCVVPGSQPPTLTTDTSLQAGSTFSWYVDHGQANTPFLLAVNGTNQGSLLGLPNLTVPYPMFDPANPTLPAPGLPALRWPAPDCWLNIDPVTTFLGVCDGQGHGAVVTSIPPGRANVGVSLYGQGILLAPTANPLQLVTTLGRQSSVCGPLGVARVYAFYNGSLTPTPPPPTSGTLQYGVGLVFEVR
jgi:hypothetical protein